MTFQRLRISSSQILFNRVETHFRHFFTGSLLPQLSEVAGKFIIHSAYSSSVMIFSLSSFLRSCHSSRNSFSRWLWNCIAGCGFPSSSVTEIIEKLLVWCFLDSCSKSKSKCMKVSVFSKDGFFRELTFTSSTFAISDNNSDFGVLCRFHIERFVHQQIFHRSRVSFQVPSV